MEDADIIVIGGGAAGLLAAGAAASEGADVLLLEKMPATGRKLLLTGKGRCNLTNIAPRTEFIQHFGRNGRFLQRPFAQFFSQELLDLLAGEGVEVVTERGGRVFPATGHAETVGDALLAYARKHGVRIWTSAEVTGIQTTGSRSFNLTLADRGTEGPRVLTAARIILATGGASYPGTGSSGDGYRFAEALGHHVYPIRPALVPLTTRGNTAQKLQGLSLRNVRLTLLVEGKPVDEAFGEMVFTHFGISGPIVLTVSKGAVDALQAGKSVAVSFDLKPALDDEKLDARLRRDLDAQGRKQVNTLLKGLLPRKLIPVCVEETGLDPSLAAHQVTAEQRNRLRTWLKDFRFDISGHRSFKQAVITAGGIDLREVDSGTMQSRLIPGLYFAGEVLDLDADTGGYNLQAAFTTGWVAGSAAASTD